MLLSGTTAFTLAGGGVASAGLGDMRGLDFNETLLLSPVQEPEAPSRSLSGSSEKDRCLGSDLVVALRLLPMSEPGVSAAIQLTRRDATGAGVSGADMTWQQPSKGSSEIEAPDNTFLNDVNYFAAT